MRKFRTNAVYIAITFICLFFLSCAATKPDVQSNVSKAISADGSRIAYGIKGKGEPALLFVHGWLCDHTFWQRQIDFFSKNHRVAWLDLAGHGDSEAKRKEFTMTAFARDVVSVVDKIEGEKIILVGHSMGGPIIIEAAELLGDKVIGLVGVDAFYTPLSAVPEKNKLFFLGKLKDDYPKALMETVNSMFSSNTDPNFIKSTYKKMLSNDHEMGVDALYHCIKWNSQKETPMLKKYSDILCNINGAPTGKEEKIHESVVLIPGVGHFVAKLKPNEFNAELDGIIKMINSR